MVGSHERGANEGTGPPPDDAAILRRGRRWRSLAVRPKSGYMQHLDHGELVAAARDAGAMLVFRFRPGQFVLRGEPLVSVVPDGRSARWSGHSIATS